MYDKIMVMKLGAIGDTLMSTPFLRQLKKNYPKSKIDYWVGKKSGSVLLGNKNIDNLFLFDEEIFFNKQLFRFLKLSKEVRSKNYDVIFVLDKHWIFSLFAKMSGISARIGFSRNKKINPFLTKTIFYDNKNHEIFYYLDLLKCTGSIPDYADNLLDLFIPQSDLNYASLEWKKHGLKGKRVICVAPGGGNNAGEKTGVRNMPVEKYAQLISILQKKYVIILVGNSADKEKEKYILDSVGKNNIISYVGKCSIPQTASLMKKCNYVICNDSGAMHIASCVNKHVLSIFGPTNPKRKAPLHKESKSIWKDKKIYAPEYELYGKIPKSKEFFKTIDVKEIIGLIKLK